MKLGVVGLALLLFTTAWAGPPRLPELALGGTPQAKGDDAKAKFMAGTMVIYKGPLKDNTGKVIIAEGSEQRQTDVELEKMDYLVEGVVGKTH